MARATGTVQNIYVDPSANISLTFAEATDDGPNNGITFPHSKNRPCVLVVKNDTVSSVTVTIKSNGRQNEGAKAPDLVHTLGAGPGAIAMYVASPEEYADDEGLLNVDVSESTDVGIAGAVFGLDGKTYTLPYQSPTVG